MTTETFRIVVEIDPKTAVRGSKQVRGELDKIGTSADRMRQALHRALALAGVSFGIREVIRLADAYTNLQNKIRTVVSSNAQLEKVTQDLFNISQATRQSFTTTAQVYARTAASTKNLGVSQKELIVFTTRLNQAVALSGSTAQEASNALLQLSQGLSSQALRGEELRSVLEQLPVVADVIAKEFGVTRTALKDLGKQGVLTPERILIAFRKMGDELGDRFAKLLPTISQGFQTLYNAIVKYVGELNKSSGFGASASKVLTFLADNIDTVARVAAALALIISVGLVKGGIALLIEALGSTVALLGVAIALMITFSDKIKLSKDGMLNLRDLSIEVFSRIIDTAKDLFNYLDYKFNDLPNSADKSNRDVEYSFENLVLGIGALMDTMSIGMRVTWEFLKDGFTDVAKSVGYVFSSTFDNIIKGIETTINAVLSTARKLPGAKKLGLDKVGDVDLSGFQTGLTYTDTRRSFAELGDYAENQVGSPAYNYLSGLIQSAKDRARKRAALGDLLGGDDGNGGTPPPGSGTAGNGPTFRELLENYRVEGELLKKSRREREILSEVIRVEEQLKRKLNATERDLLTRQLEYNQILNDQANLYEEIRGPQDQYRYNVAALKALLDKGRISLGEYNVKLRELELNALAADRSMSGGLRRGLLTLTDEFTNMSSVVEDSVTGAFRKLEDVLTDFVKTGKFSIKSFVDSVLTDLARLFVRSNFTSVIAGAFGSLSGGGGSKGGTSAAGLASGGSSIISGLLNGFSTPIFDPLSTAFDIGDFLGLDLSSQIGLADGLSNFTPGAGLASFGGNLLGNLLLGDRGIGSTVGGTIGGLTGTFFGGPIGGFVGSLAGNALGGLFGNKKPSSKLQSGVVDTSTGNILSRGGLTGNKFSQENFDAVTQLASIVSGISQALGIGQDISLARGGRSGFEYAFGNNLGVFDTDSPLRKQFENPGQLIESLLKDFREQFPDKFSETLVTAMKNIKFDGGEEAFQQALSDFVFALNFDKIFGDVKEPVSQLKLQLDELNKGFNEAARTAERLGLSVDKVRSAQARANAEFLKTVNQGIYDQILEVVNPTKLARLQEERRFKTQLDEVQAVNGDIEAVYELHRLKMLQIEQSAAQEEINSLQQRVSEANKLSEAYAKLANSLQDTINAIKIGPLSTLSPLGRLNEAKSIFGDTLNRALLGDQDALGELGKIGNSVIELSYAQNASNELFAADQAMVLDGLARARDVALRQVDVQAHIASTLDQQLQATINGFNVLSQALAGRLGNSTGDSPFIDPYTGTGKNAAGVSLTSASGAYSLSVGQVESIYRKALGYSGSSGNGELASLYSSASTSVRAQIDAEVKKAAGFADGGLTPTNGFFTVGERGREVGSFNTQMRITPIEDAGELIAELREANDHLRAQVIILSEALPQMVASSEKTKNNTARIADDAALATNRRK